MKRRVGDVMLSHASRIMDGLACYMRVLAFNVAGCGMRVAVHIKSTATHGLSRCVCISCTQAAQQACRECLPCTMPCTWPHAWTVHAWATTYFVNPLPSTRTTIQQPGSKVSSNSYFFTYSYLLFAILLCFLPNCETASDASMRLCSWLQKSLGL